MSYRSLILILFGLMLHRPAAGQLLTYTFDNNTLTPVVTNGLLEASSFQVSSGNLFLGNTAVAGLQPPFVQATGWSASSRESSRFFFFDVSLLEGFVLEINRVELQLHATPSGPERAGLTIGNVEMESVMLPSAETVSLSFELKDPISMEDGVRFQVHAWLDGSRGSSGQGQLRVDNVIVYGQISPISEEARVPIVSEPIVLNKSTNSVILQAEVLFEGNTTVQQAGYLIDFPGESPLTIGTSETVFVPFNAGLNSVNQEISGLEEARAYRVRVVAQNDIGESYSAERQFATRRGFNGQGYRFDFSGVVPGFEHGTEWMFSDTLSQGSFGVGTVGGLRFGNGIAGYQLTNSQQSFSAELTLVNTTGATLNEIIIGYSGFAGRTQVDRSPAWEVTVNDVPVPALSYSTSKGHHRPGVQSIVDELAIPDGQTFRITWKTTVVPGTGNHRQIGFGEVHVAIPSVVHLPVTGDAGWRMYAMPHWYPRASDIGSISPIQGFPGQQVPANIYTGYDGTSWVPLQLEEESVEKDWLVPGSGFLVYVFDNDRAGSVPIGSGRSIPFTGIDHLQEVVIPVHSQGDGWNLLGNPYTTSFDIRELITDGGGMPVVQVWKDAPGNPSLEGGASGSWVLSNGSMLNHMIPAGQGFMWQNDPVNPSTWVRFPFSGKSFSTGTRLRALPVPRVEFVVEATHQDGWVAKDMALQLVAVGSSEIPLYSVPKLAPLASRPQVMFVQEHSGESQYLAQVAIEREFNGTLEIPIKVNIPDTGWTSIELSWPFLLDIPSYWVLEVVHKPTQTRYDLREMNSVTLYPSGGTEPDWVLSVRNILISSIAESDNVPARTTLSEGFPNPFNPETSFWVHLSETSRVRVEIFDVLGRSVAVLSDGVLPAGVHTLTWNAADRNSGTYLVRMSTEQTTSVRKVMLIK